MLKMLKPVALAVAVLLVGVLGYAATKPDTFRVQRSIAIDAPPEKIFPYLNDPRLAAQWSPWEKKDPAMKRTYSGAASGVGAVYAWDGNSDVGKGTMEITESVAPSKVVMKLDFVSPFEGHNIAEYTLATKGAGTEVTWAMYGPQPFLGKLMSLVYDCDTMIGKDFEAGLASLKALTEK